MSCESGKRCYGGERFIAGVSLPSYMRSSRRRVFLLLLLPALLPPRFWLALLDGWDS